MKWNLDFHPKARVEYNALDGSPKKQVSKAIDKVLQNPLSKFEGGYGNSLGNKASSKLAGCLGIKLKKTGLRVVYRLIREGGVMNIIVISIRDDDEVYKEAERRLYEE